MLYHRLKSPSYLLDMIVGGLQSWFGRCGVDKNTSLIYWTLRLMTNLPDSWPIRKIPRSRLGRVIVSPDLFLYSLSVRVFIGIVLRLRYGYLRLLSNAFGRLKPSAPSGAPQNRIPTFRRSVRRIFTEGYWPSYPTDLSSMLWSKSQLVENVMTMILMPVQG
jgi:hypothetical protein